MAGVGFEGSSFLMISLLLCLILLKGGERMEIDSKDNYVYVYNLLQTQFYISRGKVVKDVGIHYVTKKMWHKFSRADTADTYQDWLNHDRNKYVSNNSNN